MTNRLHVLLIEDEPSHATLIRRHLASVSLAGVELTWVERLSAGVEMLERQRFDAVLSDLRLPDSDFAQSLPRLLKAAGASPLIVLTSLDDDQLAAHAVQQGAQDYLPKSQLSGELLLRAIRYAIERKRSEAELRSTVMQLRELNDNLEARIFERTRSLLRYQTRLRALTSELTLTEQRERRRLATDLHDYLAQLLVVSRMKLGRVIRHDHTDETILSELDGMLKDCIDYTRTLIAELSPAVLYESGLPAAVSWLGRQMQRHGLTVMLEQHGEIHPLAEDRLVLVFQTIRELLFNVIKHAGVSEAKVILRQLEHELEVSVEDEGVGCEPMGHGDHAGSGKFGLFNIRERIESLDGVFRVEPNGSRGTRAVFTVRGQPTAPAARPAHSRAAAVPADGAAPSDGANIRVLLVDDHELVRQGLRSVIEAAGEMEVVGEAGNGEQAVQLALNLRPDAVVMDVNMPLLNGIEATRRIKQQLPAVAVVGLSVHDDPSVIESMKQAGATSFFTKGESAHDLCDAIRFACADREGVGA